MKMHAVALAMALASSTVLATEVTLLDAAQSGDRAAALAALKQGGDVHERGPDGSTPLLWAVYNGELELVKQLIAAGADVNAKNEFGAFPLSEAAMTGSAPLIKALLAGGAAVDEANPEGETSLLVVARTGRIEAAKELLDAGADVNAIELWGQQSALMWAAAQSQPEMIKLLIAHGADVNARGVVRNWERKVIAEPRPKDMNQGGFTPLLYAAREGCLDCVRELVAGHADLDKPDPHRVTPVIMAMLNAHFDVAAYLLEAGADINKWDLYGRSPLYMAADMSTLPTGGNGSMSVLPSMDEHTALDVARLLLDKGANPNLQLKRRPPYRNVPNDRRGDLILTQGATPLLRAARAGDAPMVELLLAHGALVDLPSNQGVTPLMAAAGVEYGLRVTRGRNRTEEGVLKTLQLLLDAGADISARMVAEAANASQLPVTQQDLGDFSFEYRGRQVPSLRAVPDQTALHGAARNGFTSVVTFLVEHGADVNAKDSNGRTPLDQAMGNYTDPYLRQKAEPQVETAEVLKGLMAASPAPAR